MGGQCSRTGFGSIVPSCGGLSTGGGRVEVDARWAAAESGRNWGPRRALRVFSKKLFGRGGALFGGDWGGVGTARGDGAAG